MKTVKGTKKEDWKEGIVEFSFGGVDYAMKVAKLNLKNLTPLEVKENLNTIPAKFAYWSTIKNDIEQTIESVNEDFNVWMAEMYEDLEGEKKTENWKKNQVILRNVDEYKEWKSKLNALHYANKQVDVIVKSYNIMTWTLREIARVIYAELSNIEATGSGSLNKF